MLVVNMMACGLDQALRACCGPHWRTAARATATPLWASVLLKRLPVLLRLGNVLLRDVLVDVRRMPERELLLGPEPRTRTTHQTTPPEPQ